MQSSAPSNVWAARWAVTPAVNLGERFTMGIFSSLAGTVKQEAQRNFIARADEAKNQLVYKYPERNIRIMTQLTVQADEVALFVKDGVVVGQLGAGRHNLDTNNVPFLSRLLEKVTLRSKEMTVLEAAFRTAEHFALHAGQIYFATKRLTAEPLGFFTHNRKPAS